MKIFKEITPIRNWVNEKKSSSVAVGFVPTMGFLHAGHASLIQKAAQENQEVVVSIFVNPTQFGPGEDLDSYPKDFENDLKICEEAGATAIFYPSVEEMYPEKQATLVLNNSMTNVLCGAKRPNHFDGVCGVVSKLFHIIPAQKAYFGQKDFQQLAILKKMVQDLNFDIQLVPCPIVRETSGLALSSRNTYLTEQEKTDATVLYQSLQQAKKQLENGNTNLEQIRENIINNIQSVSSAKIDYVEILDAVYLQPTIAADNILIAVAVYFGKARLIDNVHYTKH